jgi:hypothetical protein
MQFANWESWNLAWHVDAAGNYYVDRHMISIQRWTHDGVPIYPPPSQWTSKAFADAVPADDIRPSPNQIWHDLESGDLFHIANTRVSRPFGVGVWSGSVGGQRVTRYHDGKPLWSVGRHAAGSVAKPGEAKFLWRVAGVAHGCVVVCDVDDGMVHVWDPDGLWVGRLLDRHADDGLPDGAYQLCGENFHGSLYTDPKTGEVLFFGGTYNSTNVYRIRGWDRFSRQSGTVELPAEAAQAAAARAKAWSPGADRVLHIRSLAEPIKVDGDLTEWTGVEPARIADGNETRAKVYLGWRPDGWYAAFDVNTTTPWASASTETLAFRQGASVEVRFGPAQPQRDRPVPGDARVVASPIGAVEFLPVLPEDGRAASKPATYETGNGKATFARAAALLANWSAAKRKPDGSGYTVELRLPVYAPLSLHAGTRFRLDASVMLAAPSGDATTARLPMHSRDPNDMAVQDVYLESLLRPQNWAEAVLDK